MSQNIIGIINTNYQRPQEPTSFSQDNAPGMSMGKGKAKNKGKGKCTLNHDPNMQEVYCHRTTVIKMQEKDPLPPA